MGKTLNIIGTPREKNQHTGNYSVPCNMYTGHYVKKSFMFVDEDLHGEIFSFDEIFPLIKTIHAKTEYGKYITFGIVRKDDVYALYGEHHKNDVSVNCYEVYGPLERNSNTGNISLSMKWVCGDAEKKYFHFNISGLDKYLIPWQYVVTNLFGMTDRAYRNVDKLWDKCCYISKAKLFKYVKTHPDIKLYI